MSNTFTKAAFALLMSREDAALLREAEKAVDLLDTNGDDAELATAYETPTSASARSSRRRGAAGSTASSNSSTTATFPTSTPGSRSRTQNPLTMSA